METVFTSSLVTGIVLAIITWLIVTFGDCLKRAKEKDELTTWGLFKKEVFSKNTLLALTILIVVSVLIAFLGILFIGLAIFFLPLLKGKLNDGRIIILPSIQLLPSPFCRNEGLYLDTFYCGVLYQRSHV